MASLPLVDPDHSIIEICESVAQGDISVSEGIANVEKRLKPTLKDHTDTNKITVLAVLTVEKLVPSSAGVFLSLEDLDAMWNHSQEITDKNPTLQMSFLVLSCMQLTTVGALRNGAKAMGQTIDKMMPEGDQEPNQSDLN